MYLRLRMYSGIILGLEQYLPMSDLRAAALEELASAWSLTRLATARCQCFQNTADFPCILDPNFPGTVGTIFAGKTHLWKFLG
jgi:hypothetical protein